ncbi:MAG: hypothetical protein RMJ14_02595 [Nitrososphaerota archaeon]|nr:hypothetical protein [Aigarchaeota archaeon]MDW8076512.1 hypothetical protein [Nitrososphaerota archaeon]
MCSIKKSMKTDTARVKIRRECTDQSWPDITQSIVNFFPRLIQTFEEANDFFQEKTSRYPLEYYELFVSPAIAVLSLEEVEKLITILEEKTSAKVDEGSFKISFNGKQYTISIEYPCG